MIDKVYHYYNKDRSAEIINITLNANKGKFLLTGSKFNKVGEDEFEIQLSFLPDNNLSNRIQLSRTDRVVSKNNSSVKHKNIGEYEIETSFHTHGYDVVNILLSMKTNGSYDIRENSKDYSGSFEKEFIKIYSSFALFGFQNQENLYFALFNDTKKEDINIDIFDYKKFIEKEK